jgi:hypothetical protein
MERKRVKVPPAEIEAFNERLKEVISGLRTGFVFNADEIGYQELANRTFQRVVVPVSHPDEVIEILFSWPSKRVNARLRRR